MGKQSYSYPFDPEWTTAEITGVISFYRVVEAAYEGGVDRQRFLDCYQRFQSILGSKMREKQYEREFAAVSGYQPYQVVKLARKSSGKIIKVAGDK